MSKQEADQRFRVLCGQAVAMSQTQPEEADRLLREAHSLVTEHDLGVAFACYCLLLRGRLALHLDRRAQAEQLFVRAQELGEQFTPPVPNMGYIYAEVAGLRSLQQRWDEGEKFGRQAIQLLMAMDPEKRWPDIAKAVQAVAEALINRGGLEDAIHLVQDSIDLAEQAASGRTLGLLLLLPGLGKLLMLARRFDEAKLALKRVFHLGKQSSPPNRHVQTIACCQIAECYRLQGRDRKMILTMRRASRYARLISDPQPLFMAACMNQMASACLAMGEFNRAAWAARLACKGYMKALGRFHCEVATVMQALGEAQYGQGKLEKAENTMRRALAIHQRLQGMPSPNMAGCMANLGVLARQAGRLAEAESLFRRAMIMREEHFSQIKKVHRIDARRELAVTLRLMKRSEEADVLEREGIELALFPSIPLETPRKSSGPMPVLLTQAELHDRLDRLLQDVVEATIEGKAERHEAALVEGIDMAASLETLDWRQASLLFFLGKIRAGRGEVDDAEELVQRALRIIEQTGPQSLWVSGMLLLLANLRIHRHRFAEAEQILRQGWAHTQSNPSQQTNLVATQLAQRLSETLDRLGRPEEAISFATTALELTVEAQGSNSDTIRSAIALIDSNIRLNRRDEAVALSRRFAILILHRSANDLPLDPSLPRQLGDRCFALNQNDVAAGIMWKFPR